MVPPRSVADALAGTVQPAAIQPPPQGLGGVAASHAPVARIEVVLHGLYYIRKKQTVSGSWTLTPRAGRSCGGGSNRAARRRS